MSEVPFIYLTGPVRCGKSRQAVEFGKRWGQDVVFVATYRAEGGDLEMSARRTRHRAERPGWRTLEAPLDIATTLKEMSPAASGVIVDCLTLWISDRLALSDEELLAKWQVELVGLRALRVPVVIVGNEVGWDPVPDLPVLRRFRDLAGVLGQKTAALASEAWLVVAGCAVPLQKNFR